MRLTLSIPSFGPFFPPGRLHELIDLARRAEVAGVDTVIVPDHVVMSERVEAYAAGATDVQLGLLAFVRKPEQLEAFFGELRERRAELS
ncbi:MAG: hypothetical protein ACRETX_16705 [Steroidobacteraceae bacterium]